VIPRRTGVAAALAVVLVACGASAPASPDAAARAHLLSVDELAAGRLDSLPTGDQFIRVLRFTQAAGNAFPSRKHQPGIVYQETGEQLLTYEGEAGTTIDAGRAAYQRSVQHAHSNSGAGPSVWYFVALWPTAQRGAPLVNATAQVAFETEDIAPLAPGSYTETLRRITLQPGGRTAAQRVGGAQVVFVLDGVVTVHIAGHTAVRLASGDGVFVPPDTGVQAFATGTAPAVSLDFVVIRDGSPFETDLLSTVG